MQPDNKKGVIVAATSALLNLLLGVIKTITGIFGNSYALIADGIESFMDFLSSAIVSTSLRYSLKPPDKNHPYGHGKAESLAGLSVALFLLVAAVIILIQSINEILNPHEVPEAYTLIVLFLIIIFKELLYRKIFSTGHLLESTALKSDAWHQRSDALTSLAAFIGISIALFGGQNYAAADDWAASFACLIIFYNGFRLMKHSIDEIMDKAVSTDMHKKIRQQAMEVEDVLDIDKCRIRKSGLGYLMDIHVVVDGKLSVKSGHYIAHEVKDHLLKKNPQIKDIIVHTEPDEF